MSPYVVRRSLRRQSIETSEIVRPGVVADGSRCAAPVARPGGGFCFACPSQVRVLFPRAPGPGLALESTYHPRRYVRAHRLMQGVWHEADRTVSARGCDGGGDDGM